MLLTNKVSHGERSTILNIFMRKFFVVIILILVAIGGIWFWQTKRVITINDVVFQPSMEKIVLKSSAFENNSKIPPKYTCDGQDVNPPLSISKVPTDAETLVLIVDDPDAPAGTFCHWTVWNILPQTEEILENSLPEEAVEGETDFGKTGWGGPCPPSGTHRYFFRIYALDTKIELEKGADKNELEKAMEGHILGEGELIGLYSRQ